MSQGPIYIHVYDTRSFFIFAARRTMCCIHIVCSSADHIHSCPQRPRVERWELRHIIYFLKGCFLCTCFCSNWSVCFLCCFLTESVSIYQSGRIVGIVGAASLVFIRTLKEQNASLIGSVVVPFFSTSAFLLVLLPLLPSVFLLRSPLSWKRPEAPWTVYTFFLKLCKH